MGIDEGLGLIEIVRMNMIERLTRTTASLAARAKMSAQETRPGQAASTACLALTTVSKPSPARERLS